MAKSQYEYVKQFELSDAILPSCWIVVRIDGVGFTKFTAAHALAKPNDARCMHLMNTAARAVCTAFPDIVMAQGMSDEYSFLLHAASALYNRRASKINSAITSLFTSSFVFHWPTFFPASPLRPDNLPSFDGRCVAYPTDAIVKDYFRWRQVDVHINNLYNTCFWALVHEYSKPSAEQSQQAQAALSEKSARERAHAEMNSTYASSAAKHELLFARFARNYNDEPAQWRKGSILLWTTTTQPEEGAAQATTEAAAATQETTTAAAASVAASSSVAAPAAASSSAASSSSPAVRVRRVLSVLHCDLIADSFWTHDHPGIVPYRSATQTKKDDKAADKANKKAAHKAREKEEKNKTVADAKAAANTPAATSTSAAVASTSEESALSASSAASTTAALSQPE